MGGLACSESGVEGPFKQAWTIDGVFNTDFISAGSIMTNHLSSDVESSLDLSSNESIKMFVSSIHNGNIIPNLNGDLGYVGWQGKGRLISTPDLVQRHGLKIGHSFIPKKFENSLSDWGISFFWGGDERPVGNVLQGSYYSFRSKVVNFIPFSIIVKEFDNEMNLINILEYSFSENKVYLEFRHYQLDNTGFISLQFLPVGATINNRLELTEMMFSRGEPKSWFENAYSVKTWAESQFELQSDQIKFAVDEISGVDSKINNSPVKITAKDGVEIWNNNGKIAGLNFDGSKISFPDGSLKLNSTRNTIEFGNVDMAFGDNTQDGQGVLIKDKSGQWQDGIFLHVGGGIRVKAIQPTIFESGNLQRLDIHGADTVSTYLLNVTNKIGTPFNGVVNIGDSTNRFNNIYLRNQPNVSSNIRYKYSIQDIPQDLIEEISKVESKMYLQHKTWHFGYIAQDVERALYKWATKEFGKDAKYYVDKFAFLHKDESYLSLLYGEIAVLKERAMSERIDKLEKELQEIKELLKERND